MMFYKEINVWQKRDDNTLICFRCFELIPSGGYCVQSADIYNKNSKISELEFKQQLMELLIEESPETRSDLFPTLHEAIEAHIHEFENF